MQRLLAFVLHATAAYIMTWGWFKIGEVDSVDNWIRSQKGGYYQFLTNQGLFISWGCMVVSLFCDVFPASKNAFQLKRALLLISLPLEFVISTIYWSLLLFLPHLIMRPLDEPDPLRGGAPKLMRLPLSTDLALHASPLVTLLINFFVFEPKYSRMYARKVAPATVVAFAIWYASFVEYCASFNGSFPYPFLTYSPLMGRVLIYTTTAGIALGCFRTLNALHA